MKALYLEWEDSSSIAGDTWNNIETKLPNVKCCSCGFVIKEEKVPPPAPPPQKEEIPKPEPKPPKFKDVLREIDFEGNAFKEGGFDKFTYNELNTVYGWINHYKKRKMMTGEWEDIPEGIRNKQDIAEKIVYHAIFAKMNRKLKNGN